jgi:hypothetical protein
VLKYKLVEVIILLARSFQKVCKMSPRAHFGEAVSRLTRKLTFGRLLRSRLALACNDMALLYEILSGRTIAVDTSTQFEYPFALSGQARRGRTLRTPPDSKGSNGKETFLGAAGHLPGY